MVTVLDREKWAKRALMIDVFTLGLLVVVGVSLIRSAYTLGQAMGGPGASTSINKLLVSVSLGVAALAWLSYRLIGSSYRTLSAVR